MKPEIWGPPAWTFLESVTLEYPDNPSEEEKKDMYIFLMSLGNILPCKKCRNNFKSHLSKYPINNNVLKSRNKLITWLINIHNCVNKMNKKDTYSYEEALKSCLLKYEQKTNYMFILFSLFLVILSFVVIIYKLTF